MSDRSGQPDSNHWQTPQWLYDYLDKKYHFDFDPCPNYADFDGLTIPWGKSNFVNPPYDRVTKPKFIQKAYDEWCLGKRSVLLIPSATGTKQFHDIILPNADIYFLKGRIAFVEGGKPRDSKSTQKGKHDSMIVIFDLHDQSQEIRGINLQALTQAQPVDTWQPIETAPKDGTDVLLQVEGFGVRIGSYGGCRPQPDGYIANGGDPCWRTQDKYKCQPFRDKKWMPLPPTDMK